MKNNIIIFCHQPADIPFVLTVYEENHTENHIYIICTNVKNNYKFLKGLNLINAEVKFIPYLVNPTPSKPFLYIPAFFFVKWLKRRFKYENVKKVVFFAKGHDWLAHIIVDMYADIGVEIFYYPTVSFDIKPITKLKISLALHLKLIKCLFGINHSYVDLGHGVCLYYENPVIKDFLIDVDVQIYHKYSYNPNVKNTKSVLFIDQNLEDDPDLTNYKERLFEILYQFRKNGYVIYNKPHPRLGSSNVIVNFGVVELEDYIPLEFINSEDFCYIIGVFSLGLAHLASMNNSNVFSLINEFNFSDLAKKESIIRFLEDNSHNKIKFGIPKIN